MVLAAKPACTARTPWPAHAWPRAHSLLAAEIKVRLSDDPEGHYHYEPLKWVPHALRLIDMKNMGEHWQCVCSCVRACVRVCVRACVRARVRPGVRMRRPGVRTSRTRCWRVPTSCRVAW
jgi:hypothetical protein